MTISHIRVERKCSRSRLAPMFLKTTVSKHRDAVLWATVISSVALTLPNINYGAFAQTATYSIANQLGVFTSAGINVTFLQIRNSSAGYASLLNGAYDVITGTVDNGVNLRFNAKDNITVLGRLDQGPDLVLASVPSITSVQELRGKPLIVDSAASGYSFLLRTILGLYGLQLGTDCTFQVHTLFCSLLLLPLINPSVPPKSNPLPPYPRS